MKRNGHIHKESFSILMISNTGQNSKQIHISLTAFRLLVAFLVLLLVAVGLTGGIVLQSYQQGSEQDSLHAQLDASQELVKRLEEEKLILEEENTKLRQENELSGETQVRLAVEGETDTDSDIPRRYPALGRSTVLTSYAEDSPYLAISIGSEGVIVAAGSGTVVEVTSDDTYPVIIEVEHKRNYTTRYMCHQSAEVLATQGAQVEVGDTLFTITADDTQLDYQIFYDGNPIDPLTVIEAKG